MRVQSCLFYTVLECTYALFYLRLFSFTSLSDVIESTIRVLAPRNSKICAPHKDSPT